MYLEQLGEIANKINRFDNEITHKSEKLQKEIKTLFAQELEKITEYSERQKIEVQGVGAKLFDVLESTNAQLSSKSDQLSKFEEKQTEVMNTVSEKIIDFE